MSVRYDRQFKLPRQLFTFSVSSISLRHADRFSAFAARSAGAIDGDNSGSVDAISLWTVIEICMYRE